MAEAVRMGRAALREPVFLDRQQAIAESVAAFLGALAMRERVPDLECLMIARPASSRGTATEVLVMGTASTTDDPDGWGAVSGNLTGTPGGQEYHAVRIPSHVPDDTAHGGAGERDARSEAAGTVLPDDEEFAEALDVCLRGLRVSDPSQAIRSAVVALARRMLDAMREGGTRPLVRDTRAAARAIAERLAEEADRALAGLPAGATVVICPALREYGRTAATVSVEQVSETAFAGPPLPAEEARVERAEHARRLLAAMDGAARRAIR